MAASPLKYFTPVSRNRQYRHESVFIFAGIAAEPPEQWKRVCGKRRTLHQPMKTKNNHTHIHSTSSRLPKATLLTAWGPIICQPDHVIFHEISLAKMHLRSGQSEWIKPPHLLVVPPAFSPAHEENQLSRRYDTYYKKTICMLIIMSGLHLPYPPHREDCLVICARGGNGRAASDRM